MIWLIIAFVVIALIAKISDESTSWGESIGMAIYLLVLTAVFWVPITENIPAPGS